MVATWDVNPTPPIPVPNEKPARGGLCGLLFKFSFRHLDDTDDLVVFEIFSRPMLPIEQELDHSLRNILEIDIAQVIEVRGLAALTTKTRIRNPVMPDAEKVEDTVRNDVNSLPAS